MVKRIDILSYFKNPIPMRAVFVPAGEQPPNHQKTAPDSKNMIEFYDSRYPHTPDGQFITRYYVETLREGNKYAGLDLYGSVPDWKIDARTKEMVLDWVAYHST